MLAQLSLQEGEALVLLKEYLDLVQVRKHRFVLRQKDQVPLLGLLNLIDIIDDQVPLPSCFLDPELVSPGSQDSGSVRDLEVHFIPMMSFSTVLLVDLGKEKPNCLTKPLGNINILTHCIAI